jgi:hypothetical protein
MKMKTRHLSRIILATLIIGLALAWTLPVLAASTTFRVATVQANTGATVDVPIQVVGAPSLGAIHLELDYDPQVLTPDTVTRGALAGSNALTDFNTAKPGRLVIGLVTLDAINGDGAVAIVRFKVIGESGTSSTLTLQNSKAWESGTLAEVLVKTEAGKISVGGFPFLYLAIAIVCLVLLFLFFIFILFILFMRRRRAARQPAFVQPAPYRQPAHLQNSNAFKKAEEDYFNLRGRLSAGRITQAQFHAALEKMMVQDTQGRYWVLHADTGKWLVHNGQTWVEGKPY